MPLPEGFALPPLPYLVALVVAIATIGVLLVALRPPVTQATILAFTPWIVAGAALHVLYVVDAVSPAAAPLLGTPAVYLTTFAIAGAVWAGASFLGASRRSEARIARWLGAVGLGIAAVAVGFVLLMGIQRGNLAVAWPLIATVVSVVVAALAWLGLSLTHTPVVARTGAVGALVVFSHVFDGVSTAIGVDILGVGERSPLPRLVMDAAAALPGAETLGVGWPFAVVKLALALAVVALFADYVEESPAEGYLLLGLIAAAGLGPAVHNVLLFAVGG